MRCEFCHKSLTLKEIAICAKCKNSYRKVWKSSSSAPCQWSKANRKVMKHD